MEDVYVGLRNYREVCSNKEGSFHKGPQSEVGAGLLDRELSVADLEEVRVVVAAKVAVGREEGVEVDDVRNGAPVV